MMTSKRILIADDDVDLVHNLRERLEGEGFEVIEASEGFRVPELIREKKTDLVLLDINMPLGTGDTVIQCLKSRPDTREIPVMILTAMDSPGLEQRMKTYGAQCFFRKPFKTKQLLEKIRWCLKQTL